MAFGLVLGTRPGVVQLERVNSEPKGSGQLPVLSDCFTLIACLGACMTRLGVVVWCTARSGFLYLRVQTATYLGENMNRRVVLIIDGQDQLRHALDERNYLTSVSSASEALNVYSKNQPDLVVVNGNGVPSEGLEVCRDLRAISEVAILVVATEMDEVDELLAYALGADDCMIGPVSIRRFVAKVTALTRRKKPRHTQARPELLRHGSISLDVSGRHVLVENQAINLTRTEFDILAKLMERPNHVITRGSLVQEIWPDWVGDERVIEVHISRLRRKIVAAGGPRIVEAVRGVGYRLGLQQAVH